MKPTLRILVIEDHSLFADALAGVLRRLAANVSIVAAGSAEVALEALSGEAKFGLVLLDLGLPGLRGRAAFDAVKAHARGAPIVIVSSVEPSAETRELMRAGARGYVHKRATAEELISVLRFVVEGGTQIPTALLNAPESKDDSIVLTPRQREVLTLLAKGSSNREIAEELKISEATVRVHVSSIMRVLDVENRTQAATTPYARRLVDSD
jgi:two-component system, NarL family, nitrate/nitrite response regulator NarL